MIRRLSLRQKKRSSQQVLTEIDIMRSGNQQHYTVQSYCHRTLDDKLEEKQMLQEIEERDRTLLIFDRLAYQTTDIVANWVCQRVEQIAKRLEDEQFSGEIMRNGQSAIILMVTPNRMRKNSLMSAVHDKINFPSLFDATGYTVDRVYNEGNELISVTMSCEKAGKSKKNERRARSAPSSFAKPQIEIHACEAHEAKAYASVAQALFIDGIGEFMSTDGVFERCLAPLLRFSDNMNSGASRVVCAVLPVHDSRSLELAAHLCPSSFKEPDNKLHERVYGRSTSTEEDDDRETFWPRGKFVCQCLDPSTIKHIMRHMIEEEMCKALLRDFNADEVASVTMSRSESSDRTLSELDDVRQISIDSPSPPPPDHPPPLAVPTTTPPAPPLPSTPSPAATESILKSPRPTRRAPLRPLPPILEIAEEAPPRLPSQETQNSIGKTRPRRATITSYSLSRTLDTINKLKSPRNEQ